MVRLHATRLMRRGEVALWHGGTIVWQGNVGAKLDGVTFDAVSMNVEDGERLASLAGNEIADVETVLAALADWWV
jgi:hypothetical protein